MNEKVKSQIIIQARLGSTRLPGKVLKILGDKPVLHHVVERSKAASLVNRVIVATTTNSEDKKIIEWCKQNKIHCIAGSENNVLSRYLQALKEFPAETIIRITADCPLTDPGIIDSLLTLHYSLNSQYTSNVIKPTYPAGLDAEVINAETLKKVGKMATLNSHKEHVTMYIRENLKEFKTTNLEFGQNYEHIRLTLDRPEDYQMLQVLFKKLKSHLASVYEILNIIKNNPELIKINSNIDRYEGMRKSAAQENRKLNI